LGENRGNLRGKREIGEIRGEILERRGEILEGRGEI
jgi:hypothetical protein